MKEKNRKRVEKKGVKSSSLEAKSWEVKLEVDWNTIVSSPLGSGSGLDRYPY